MSRIGFYRADRSRYGCFSNFSQHPFELDGLAWPTSEHYFQAMKFAGTPHVEEIRLAPGPMDAALMGRDRNRPLRGDWDQVKDDVMRRALRAKFTQHAALAATLVATGDARLVEETSNDYYWGVGTEGTGRNMLGVLLMELRAELAGGQAGIQGGWSAAT